MRRDLAMRLNLTGLSGVVGRRLIVVFCGLSWLSAALGSEPVKSSDARKFFQNHVRPVLANHCWSCHGPDESARQAGLRLDRRETALLKSESGKIAVLPGKPDASEVILRIESHDPDKLMPPASVKKPLSESQKKTLRRWIGSGAEYSQHWAFVAPQRPAVPKATIRNRGTRDSGSFEIRNPIDAFVLKRLEDEGLSPSREADRATWLRRVTLDLTGLPSSTVELETFLVDKSDDAHERVVDRLLASPRSAERLAMQWLDAARYADTNGYNNDEVRTMWPWRDWVIDAFRRGLPYDQFVAEQLAGDLLPNATLAQRVATGFNRNHVLTTEGGIIEEEYHVEYVADRVHTTASAFMGLTLQCARCHDHKFDPLTQRDYYQFAAFFNNIPDKVVGYSQGRMASPLLKVPSPEQTAELHRLERRRVELEQSLKQRAAGIAAEVARWEQSLTAIDDLQIYSLELTAEDAANLASGQSQERLKDILAVAADKRTETLRDELRKFYLDRIDVESRNLKFQISEIPRQLAEIDKAIPSTMVMEEMSERRPTYLLRRGQYDQRGEQVFSRVPQVLASDEEARRLEKGSVLTRLDLARWLTSPDHPLTARVAMNRWWEMLFGTGLVETSEDFGVQGALPSHPELLDWLATAYIRTGWDTRAMLKLIVTSATYRQSSNVAVPLRETTARLAERSDYVHALERDPQNRLLWRGPRYRLPAETVRDNALAVSGLLRQRLGGPSVKPYQPEGLWEDVSVERREKYVPDSGDGLYRRSMYTFWKRTSPPPGMSTFDAPDREFCVVRRSRTNTPLQALVLLNDPTFVEAARKLAERVMSQAVGSDEARLNLAFQIVVSRTPTATERDVLLTTYLAALDRFRRDATAAEKLLSVGATPHDSRLDVTELAAWTTITSLILNLDEAISKT